MESRRLFDEWILNKLTDIVWTACNATLVTDNIQDRGYGTSQRKATGKFMRGKSACLKLKKPALRWLHCVDVTSDRKLQSALLTLGRLSLRLSPSSLSHPPYSSPAERHVLWNSVLIIRSSVYFSLRHIVLHCVLLLKNLVQEKLQIVAPCSRGRQEIVNKEAVTPSDLNYDLYFSRYRAWDKRLHWSDLLIFLE
ncbi:hypothetical protein J6590_003480 [Homalodisca vitripennis]|nr:hypothetical protein J6590_003480 [Homalodisca vitripennis]